MSFKEYLSAVNGNMSLMNQLPAEVTFSSFRQPPGCDLHYVQHIDHGSPMFMAAAGDLANGSLFIDMVAASRQLAALNNGSSASEYSGFTLASRSLSLPACCDSPEETSSLLRPVAELEDGVVDETYSTKLHTCQAAPGGFDHEESAQNVMAKILRDHFQDASEPTSSPHSTTRISTTLDPSVKSMNPQQLEVCSQHLNNISTLSSSSEVDTIPKPSESGLPHGPDQLPTMASSQFKSLPSSSSRRSVEGGAMHERNYKYNGEIRFEGPWKQQWPSTSTRAYGLYHGPSSQMCAGSSRAYNSTLRSRMAADVVERASKPKKRRTRLRGDYPEDQSQRMTHIAVERNRRKQMNDHLSALKAIMPSSYVQRTDQASIIGGAVEFIKELELLLESLQSKQRRRAYAGVLGPSWSHVIHPGPLLNRAPPPSSAAPSTLSTTNSEEFTSSPSSSKSRMMSPERSSVITANIAVINTSELKAESRSAAASVEVKVLGNDAMVNIISQWRAKQLVKVIAALESLGFNILHTSITTNKNTVLYTFNAKVGPECRMTANQVAAALHQTFNPRHDYLGRPWQ